MIKLTNEEIEILQEIVQDRLRDIDYGPEGSELYERPEVYINILKKLETMYH